MRTLSDEHKKKLSIAHLGKKQTAEHKNNISKSCMGRKLSSVTKTKISESKVGDKNPMWKGGVAFYRVTHIQLAKKYGKARVCDNKEKNLFTFTCKGRSKNYTWAKKAHSQYTLDKNDYYQLCCSCHTKYDLRSRGTVSQ